MEITKEYLNQKISEMNMTVTAHTGAIQFAQHLLSIIEEEKDALTTEELGEMLGGTVESIDEVEN